MSAYPEATTVAEIEHNLAAVRSRIDAAATAAGRRPEDVRLLAVTKTIPAERLRLAARAGCVEFGENKVQEAKRKYLELGDLDVAWSIIGHLQTNKAKDVAAFASEFQALDSLRVATALDRRLVASDRRLDVHVQVNTSGEASKYGLVPEDVMGFLEELAGYPTLRVRGLMTLAVFSPDAEEVRSCFRTLRQLRDRVLERAPELLGPGHLSMGMSGDFEIAVEEGATCVRVGQAIFGARSTPDSHYWPAVPEAGEGPPG